MHSFNWRSQSAWDEKVEQEIIPPFALTPSLATVAAQRNKVRASEQELYLELFRDQPLEADGDFFIKWNCDENFEKGFAELRSATVVVFRNKEQALQRRLTHRDILAVVPVHNVVPLVVANEASGAHSIYLRSTGDVSSAAMFVYVPPHNEPSVRNWNEALRRILEAKLPSLLSLEFSSVLDKLFGMIPIYCTRWKEDGSCYAVTVFETWEVIEMSFWRDQALLGRNFLEEIGEHPFINQTVFAFQTTSNVFLGSPLCRGGTLRSYILNSKHTPEEPICECGVCDMNGLMESSDYRLSEEQIRLILAQVILAMDYLHSQGVLLRDCGLDSIYIDDSGNIKVGRLETAMRLCEIRYRGCRTNYYGSKHDERIRRYKSGPNKGGLYAAPELFNMENVDFRADAWSLGVIAYELAVGEVPFDEWVRTEIGERSLFALLPLSNWNLDHLLPCWLSGELIELIRGALVLEPCKRWTLSTMVQSRFLSSVDWKAVFSKQASCPLSDFAPPEAVAKVQQVTSRNRTSRRAAEPSHVYYSSRPSSECVVGLEFSKVGRQQLIPRVPEVVATRAHFLSRGQDPYGENAF